METTLTPLQNQILKILLDDTNEKKQITAEAIKHRVGINAFGATHSTRFDFIYLINLLRVRGYPICSSSGGYFYARDPKSLKRFIDKLQTRINPTLHLIEALNRCYPNVGGLQEGVKMKVSLAIRTPTGVAYRDFELGEDGEPIIPPDVELV